MYAGPGGFRGKFMAWDPIAKKEIWSIKENFPAWSGTVVTAGDVAALWNDGPPLQSRQREDRPGALGFRHRLRNHRPARHLQRPGRKAIRRHPGRRRRMGWSDRRGPA